MLLKVLRARAGFGWAPVEYYNPTSSFSWRKVFLLWWIAFVRLWIQI